MHQSTTPSFSQTIWPRWASTQFLSLPIVETLLLVTFGYSVSSQAVIMRQLSRWKRLWRRSSTCSHKKTSMEPCWSCWNSTISALQPEEITSKGTGVSCVVLSIKVPRWKKSGNLSYAPFMYVYIYIYPNILIIMYNSVCYIHRLRVLNIDDRAYVELSLDSLDTESILFCDSQFFGLCDQKALNLMIT